MTPRTDRHRWPVNPHPVIPDGGGRTERDRSRIQTPTNPGPVPPSLTEADAAVAPPTGRASAPAPPPTPATTGNDADSRGLVLDGVTRRFETITAVDDVHLGVPAGRRHAVIGPNGAGKTTLLNLIAGTVRATTGRIGHNGRDITRHDAARRARAGIGRTFQQPACHPTLTVADNLLLAAWRHASIDVRWRRRGRAELVGRGVELLDRLGIAGLAHQRAGALSHGQRRLLDIAAALAGQPTLLLLDEPAAGLVDTDLHRLLSVLRDLPRSVTVLLVDHNLDLVTAYAEQVTVLHHGRILTTGASEQIRTHPHVRQVYLGTVQQAGGDTGGGQC